MTIGQDFGRIVRRTRESLGWSQELLARRADLNRSYLGDVERGVSVPTLAVASRLAHALDVRLVSLIEQLEQALSPREGAEHDPHRTARAE
jgi:ribosome-binding protein aMBF1 (putative translation factor)